MNYTDRLQNLYTRRYDPSFSTENILQKSLFENIKSFSSYSEIEKIKEYVKNAMEAVPSRSTEISYEEGEKVRNHLENGLKIRNIIATFEYQGSVTCNTHIKGASDIDLLVITKKFIALEPPLKPDVPYNGDCISDMQELRNTCVEILKETYSKANVETNGAKSITLTGGILRRKIDVVPANWYDTKKYRETKKEYLRGIQIFDKYTKERNTNYPLYNKYLVEKKDKVCNGLFRKVVRLGKNLREDSDNKDVQNISSYDIQALFFNMPNEAYYGAEGIKIVSRLTEYLKNLLNKPDIFSEMLVPDKSRKISDKLSVSQLKCFYNEFSELNELLNKAVLATK